MQKVAQCPSRKPKTFETLSFLERQLPWANRAYVEYASIIRCHEDSADIRFENCFWKFNCFANSRLHTKEKVGCLTQQIISVVQSVPVHFAELLLVLMILSQTRP